MRTLNVAAVQMDANPAPTAERLARAEKLVAGAARAGAQLIALPELFNTGYAYSDENHERAERFDGQTVTWMRDTAAHLGAHLAGSLMLLEHGDIYNALLLFAPDGRLWRYDKNCPWGWERGYFRGPRGRRIVVAETDLGDLGFLTCWDLAHLDLWRQYAGRVDMMVICSCPPQVTDPTYHFPNGDRVTVDDMGPMMVALKRSARRIFGDMLNQQTAWLRVPAVQTVGCGHIRTGVPNSRMSVLTYSLAAPWLLKYIPQADRMEISCDLVQGCKVVGAGGQVLSELSQEEGEAFALSEVSLTDQKPVPREPQPGPLIPRIAYFVADVWLPSLARSTYRRGLRRISKVRR
ncbi:MAG: carbon-nitrogen hydrolase family protein [Anaerolineae bacterium]|nr:carbon-nitrogen hydrolase family protein [Anaerolineae bacterium]